MSTLMAFAELFHAGALLRGWGRQAVLPRPPTAGAPPVLDGEGTTFLAPVCFLQDLEGPLGPMSQEAL